MNIITCYIIDNEAHSLETLREHVLMTPGLQLIGAELDPLTALPDIQEKAPELIFLDITMPGLSGLQLTELFLPGPAIVLATAHAQYAAAAYERGILDYLLKPITYERFLQCVTRARQMLAGSAAARAVERFFFIKTGISGQLAKIELEAIQYIEAAENYCKVQLENGKQLAYLTIGEMEERLPSARFSRVHRSFIVRHMAIELWEQNELRLKSGERIPVGRAYRAGFTQKMERFLFKSWREK